MTAFTGPLSVGPGGSDDLRLRVVEREASTRALAHSPAGRELIERCGVEAVDGDYDRAETSAGGHGRL